MRKNFMLSLTAMAALPMAGFADATWSVPADNSSITDWAKVEGTDLSSSSTEQIIGIGAGISQNLPLVKGKYTVTVAKLSNAEFAIRVGDKTYSSGEQFELTDETNTVTLEVTTKDTSKQFTVGGIEIILDFNFATAKSTLNSSLQTAVAGLPATEEAQDFWQKEIATANEQAGIQTRIDALEGLNGGNKTAYDKYVAEGLYKETSNIQAAINALSADIQKANNYRAAYEEVLDAFAGMDTQLTNLKNKIAAETTSQFAKDTYATEVTNRASEIKTFKESFTYETEKIFDNKIDDKYHVAQNFEALINELLQSKSPKKWFRAYFNHGLINYIYGNKRLLPCDMSKDAFFIDPFCDVIPCNGMAKKAVMGNLKESPDWDTLWNSEQAKTVRAQTKQCDRNCWMVGSVSPAMHKYIWVPGWWVVKHKFLKGGKYSLSENAFIPEAQKK